tara:strand:+ start:185 stop:367 length:183 start_codon:yes stop_codon:yes gene_type:complete
VPAVHDKLVPIEYFDEQIFHDDLPFFAKVLANFDSEIVASIRAQSESRFVKNMFAPIATK